MANSPTPPKFNPPRLLQETEKTELDTHAQPAPGLGEEGSSSYMTKEHRYLCRRRVPRVRIGVSDSAVLIQFPELGPHRFQIRMIGELGAQFFTQAPAHLPKPGTALHALVELGSKSFPVQIRIVAAGGNSVAIEFVDPSPALRNLIRHRYHLELLAASLVPFHTYASEGAGPTHTTIYSDGEANRMELSMHNDRLEGFVCQLTPVDLRFTWTRTAPRQLKVERVSTGELAPESPLHRKVLLSFIRNLPEMPARIRQAIEQGIGA